MFYATHLFEEKNSQLIFETFFEWTTPNIASTKFSFNNIELDFEQNSGMKENWMENLAYGLGKWHPFNVI